MCNEEACFKIRSNLFLTNLNIPDFMTDKSLKLNIKFNPSAKQLFEPSTMTYFLKLITYSLLASKSLGFEMDPPTARRNEYSD